MHRFVFRITLCLLLICSASASFAASVGSVTITPSPASPAPGEPVTFRVSGSWSTTCAPTFQRLGAVGNTLTIEAISNPSCGVCPTAVTPYTFTTSTAIFQQPGTYNVQYYVTECATRSLQASGTVTITQTGCDFPRSLSITPSTIRAGETFLLSWCDPSSTSSTNPFSVLFYRVLASRNVNGPYSSLGDVPNNRTAVQFVSDAGDIGANFFFVEAHGCANTTGNCSTETVLRTNIEQLTVLAATACAPNATTLCLNNSRFAVRAHWTTPDGNNGDAAAVTLTADSGYFWFFAPDNVETVIKVLNACDAPAPRFWVFAAGLTDVGVQLTVTDTKTGAVKVYNNPVGTPFQPIQDTNAFATCGQ